MFKNMQQGAEREEHTAAGGREREQHCAGKTGRSETEQNLPACKEVRFSLSDTTEYHATQPHANLRPNAPEGHAMQEGQSLQRDTPPAATCSDPVSNTTGTLHASGAANRRECSDGGQMTQKPNMPGALTFANPMEEPTATHVGNENTERVEDNQEQHVKKGVPVRALVSNLSTLNESMLVKNILLAQKITRAHLDTCATHCFVSTRMSSKLALRGYPPIRSHVEYNVEQGNPLCVTSTVHILPLVMAKPEDGCTRWAAILFVVADCGADVIIGYPILRSGGIIDYNPPEGYEARLLETGHRQPARAELEEHTRSILQQGSSYHYGTPEDYGNYTENSDSFGVEPPNCDSAVLKTTLNPKKKVDTRPCPAL